MENVKVHIFLILFCYVGKGISTPADVVLDFTGKVFSAIELGKGIVNVLQKNENPTEDLFLKMKESIENSKSEILTTILLESKLERVEDVVMNFHSALIDLENILHAKSDSRREKYSKMFVSRFDDNNVITYVRFLPKLLSYEIPGSSGALLELFTMSTRCNMTAFYDFKQFYMKLLSAGIALEMTYIQLTSKITMKTTVDKWIARIGELSFEFENQEKVCIEKFVEYANEDVRNADSATTLWQDNNERYFWKINDVIFLKSFGTYQFLYLKHAEGYLFWHRSDKNKMAFFSDKNEQAQRLDPTILENGKENFKSAIHGKSDKNAAKHVGEAIEKYLDDSGYTILALAVFFDGDDFPAENIIVNNQTRTFQMAIDDVQLSYCYKSGAECNLDFINVLGGHNEVDGVMRIFANIIENDGESASITQNTNSNAFALPFNILIYMLIVSGICMF